jgi:hypothetical protein
VTNQDKAGINLNIIPVSIGPQFSGENDKTQKVCILFDFSKQPVKPGEVMTSCPSSSGGGQTGQSGQTSQ